MSHVGRTGPGFLTGGSGGERTPTLRENTIKTKKHHHKVHALTEARTAQLVHLAFVASSVGAGRAEPRPLVCSQLHRLQRPWMWRQENEWCPRTECTPRSRPGEHPVHLGRVGLGP